MLNACVSFGAAFLAGMKIISPSLMRVAERAAPKLWDQAVIVAVAEALPRRVSRRPDRVARAGGRRFPSADPGELRTAGALETRGRHHTHDERRDGHVLA